MKDKLYWQQAWQDNLIETLMIVLMLAFLAYVVKLAFFEDDAPVSDHQDQTSKKD